MMIKRHTPFNCCAIDDFDVELDMSKMWKTLMVVGLVVVVASIKSSLTG